MTALIAEDLIEQAYEKQYDLVANKITTLGLEGYKAAVSGREGQRNMGLTNLLSGVLYKAGSVDNNTTFELKKYALLKIETEIGYRLNSTITKKIDAESVKKLVSEILPVFEMPNVTAKDPSSISVTELIASNTFSSEQVLGKAVSAQEVDPNTITAHLYHNDVLINTGRGLDAMDNQWEALAVAINLALDHGYSPKKGELVITGALGKIFNVEKGTYRADYGTLGKLSITVE